VALRTRDVGQEPFAVMQWTCNILVVPTGVEKVAEGIYEITLMDPRHIKGIMILLSEIFNPPNSAF
jgi:hypothetical protein